MNVTPCSTHITVTDTTGEKSMHPSIRSIVRRAIFGSIVRPDLSKQLKDEAYALVSTYYPASAATLKWSKHYSWYKSTMKKEGELELARRFYAGEDIQVSEDIRLQKPLA